MLRTSRTAPPRLFEQLAVSLRAVAGPTCAGQASNDAIAHGGGRTVD